MAILIKETTPLFSLTLETGNKRLVRSIIALSQKTRNKKKDGRDLITKLTSTFMTAVTNTRSFRSIEDLGQETKHAYFICY